MFFLLEDIMHVIYSCDGKAEFSVAVTPVCSHMILLKSFKYNCFLNYLASRKF